MADEKKKIPAPVTIAAIPILIFFAIFFAVPSVSEDLFGVSIKKTAYEESAQKTNMNNPLKNIRQSQDETDESAPKASDAETNADTRNIKSASDEQASAGTTSRTEIKPPAPAASNDKAEKAASQIGNRISELTVSEEAKRKAYEFLNDLNTQI